MSWMGRPAGYRRAERDVDADESEIDRIHSYFGESCSLPIGLVGVHFASKVDALIIRGKIGQAAEYARTARLLVMIAAVVTGVLYLVFFVLLLQLLMPL
eukprot:jgi/Hompol1/1756/HPOL_000012-RA